MRLSNQSVARLELPAGKSESITFDDSLSGFGVRLRSGGRRTWIVQYRADRQQRRMTLGKVGVVGADQARDKAKTILAQVQLGADPQAERSTERARSAVTLRGASAKYLERVKARMRPRSYTEVERHFNLHWAPLLDRAIHKIERADVALRLNEIHDESGPVAANRARSTMSAFYAWAMREGIAEKNPVAGTNKADERPRERVLSAAELVNVWNACNDDDFGRIVRLLILTGQRREEVAGIRAGEVDRSRRMWSLPSGRTKNSLPHDVPLSDASLAEIPAQRDGRDLLFGEGGGPFSGWSRCKERLDERCGVSGWTLHDLRRTAATGMNEIGVQPHVVEAALNHVSGARRGVAGVYNRAQYAAEKRQAFDRWAAHVTALIAGKASNVVALARD
jgi:integrase